MNYATPLKSRNMHFCGAPVDSVLHEYSNLPFLATHDPNFNKIVENERIKTGLNLLPLDKVVSSRGGIVWDLALKVGTMPNEIAAKLVDGSYLRAFDVHSRVIMSPYEILPDTKIVCWGGIYLKQCKTAC
jgi:hypothetical protein